MTGIGWVGKGEGIAVHPELPRVVTTDQEGAVLVVWAVGAVGEIVEIVWVGEGVGRRGPYGAVGGEGLAFVTDAGVEIREWGNLKRARVLPAELLPGGGRGREVAWSPDGRLLAVASGGQVVVIDVERMVRHDVSVGDHAGFGDWACVPEFSPDGRYLGVGNSRQGGWWYTMLRVGSDGALAYGFDYEPGDIPVVGGDNLTGAVAFTPDNARVASWVYRAPGHPDTDGPRGVLVLIDSDTGNLVWHRTIDDSLAGRPIRRPDRGSLCFTPDGTRLALGLDTGIIWLDAETGAPVHTESTGAVSAFAYAPHTGMLALTTRGPRRISWRATPR